MKTYFVLAFILMAVFGLAGWLIFGGVRGALAGTASVSGAVIALLILGHME